jgi:hypothetical protein
MKFSKLFGVLVEYRLVWFHCLFKTLLVNKPLWHEFAYTLNIENPSSCSTWNRLYLGHPRRNLPLFERYLFFGEGRPSVYYGSKHSLSVILDVDRDSLRFTIRPCKSVKIISTFPSPAWFFSRQLYFFPGEAESRLFLCDSMLWLLSHYLLIFYSGTLATPLRRNIHKGAAGAWNAIWFFCLLCTRMKTQFSPPEKSHWNQCEKSQHVVKKSNQRTEIRWILFQHFLIRIGVGVFVTLLYCARYLCVF